MSQQLYLYLSDNDQLGLAQELDGIDDTLAAVFPSRQDKLVAGPIARFAKHDDLFPILVVFRREDLNKLVLHQVNGRAEFTLDVLDCPLIEFDRCIQKDKEIIRGRLFLEPQVIESDGTTRKKPDEFLRWASNVFKVAKSCCTKWEDGSYIGKEARQLSLKGWKLSEFWE